MSSMLHKLNNIRSLRALSREFSIDVLEEMLEKLRIVTEEKRTQQQQAAQQQAEYQEKVKEGANKQVISSQADSLIKISRIWAD
ncbi:hypothetical protein LNV61_10310, partial [Klebsiella pneumoniae]|nr:hypothetical protein [Klebsiella pneumoniae]